MPFANYSLTPSENTTIAGNNVAPGGPPSAIDNAIRQIMSDGKALSDTVTSTATAVNTLGTLSAYYPNARSYVPQGATGVGAITGGSGGTNGTFTLAFSGGNFSTNPAGTFTVTGGAVTSVTLNGPGLYIGGSISAPTLDFSASTGLTGASATLTTEYLVGAGEFYLTNHATDPEQVSRFQNQANAAVEVDASVDYLNIGLTRGYAEDAADSAAEAAGSVDSVLASEYDAPQLLSAPSSIQVFGPGTVGTINADGTVTVPVSSQNLIQVPLAPGDNGVENGSTFTFTAEFASAAQITDNLTSLTVQLFDAAGSAWSAATNVDQAFLTKTLATLPIVKSVGVTSLPARAQIVPNTDASGPVTMRFGLFETAKVPFIRSVPAVVQQYIDEAMATLASLPSYANPERDYAATTASRLGLVAAMVVNGGRVADAVYGDDGNAGSYLSPKATYAAAISAGSAGGYIGLVSGQLHATARDTSSGDPLDRSVNGIGGGAPAVLDARLPVSGVTWTQDGSTGCWEAVITHRFLPQGVGPGNDGNTAIWSVSRDLSPFERVWYEWFSGTTSIAANKAQVQAAETGFTAWPDGTTSPEPRNVTAQLNYRYYLKPGAGIDPNDIDLFVNDKALVEIFGQNSSNLTCIGGMWKDNTQTPLELGGDSPDAPVKLTNQYRPRCNQHGNVGICEVEGFFHAIGIPAPGTALFDKGRTAGGGLNLFPGRAGDTDFNHDLIVTENFGIGGVYCHDTAPEADPFFKSATFREQISINDGYIAAIGSRTVSGVTGQPTIDGPYRLKKFFAIEAAGGIIPGSLDNVLGENGGFLGFSSKDADTQMAVVGLGSAPRASVTSFKNTQFYWPDTGLAVPSRYVSIASLAPYTDPDDFQTIILEDCEDISVPTRGMVLWSSYGSPDYYHLTLINTQLWDLSPNGAGYLRGKLTVGPGCRFGLGGRTRAQIRTYLDGLGVDHDIDDDTTIVNRAGTIIDYPA